MIAIPIAMILCAICLVIHLLLHTAGDNGKYFSKYSHTVHVSQITQFCSSYGHGCIEAFEREFNKHEWVRMSHYNSMITSAENYHRDGGYVHAAIIQFDGKGMILNKADWKKACKIIDAKLKTLPPYQDKNNNVDWGCPE